MERAKSLLEIHKGRCSVREATPLGQAFREMEAAGEVEITPTYSMVGYIHIATKAFLAEEKEQHE